MTKEVRVRFPRLPVRVWLSAAVLVVAVAVVASTVAVVVTGSQPRPAPTAGGHAMGTVSEPDVSGVRTYDSSALRFRFRYPADWRLKESGAIRSPEGDSVAIALVPKTAATAGTLDPPVLEVAPDPQGFSADAIMRAKWGSSAATLTVTTSTAEVAGKRAVEVVVTESDPSRKRLYTYDLIATPGTRMFDFGFSSSDASEFEMVRQQVRRIAATIETY